MISLRALPNQQGLCLAGRDALGMGSSIAHPRESEEWKGMSLEQKFEFFAPIWRVMVGGRCQIAVCQTLWFNLRVWLQTKLSTVGAL
jgi:hypothetical protein